MRKNILLTSMALACFAMGATAQSVDGSWTFQKVSDYEGLTKQPPSPQAATLQITNNQLTVAPGCVVTLKKEAYYPGGPFQSLLKSGEDEAAIGAFLGKQFSFKLAGTKTYYTADTSVSCNKLGNDFLVNDGQLVAIRGGAFFYAFKRDAGAASAVATTSTSPLPVQLKPSQLPFNVEAYSSACLGSWPKKKGVPQASIKCAPVYQPYVASSKSGDPLSLLVATHAYAKGGASNAGEDYDNPGAHGLHPVFAILPPLKDVVVVRVDDLEGGDARDSMSGAYLAIKNGKVTDQLNEGCAFDAQYVCSLPGETTKYRLQDNGKFTKSP